MRLPRTGIQPAYAASLSTAARLVTTPSAVTSPLNGNTVVTTVASALAGVGASAALCVIFAPYIVQFERCQGKTSLPFFCTAIGCLYADDNRTPAYLSDAKALGLTDAERTAIVDAIAHHPTLGDVIPGTGGARKVRFGGRGKGKRGG